MIAHLSGTVARIEANSVVLDVNGVGYLVYVPLGVLSGLPEVGGKALLHTTMAVREDDITLYGFATLDEQRAFHLVTGVTGVGPKVALSMLSVLDAGELARAISSNDTKALTKIPGVGPKLAQRVCLELGERMAEFAFSQRLETMAASSTPQENAAFEDVVEALINFGYSRPDSKKAAERAIASAADKGNVPALVRDALNILSSGGRGRV
jgi:Holliday junction DNA helicase RuvA